MESSSQIKILILGATGRTGKHALVVALQKGYLLNVLVRDASKIKPASNLSVFVGNTTNKDDLMKAAFGCSAVLSVLNISRTSDFPWATLRTPKTFLSDTMKNCIDAAQVLGIKRMVVCSAWGVAETANDVPLWFRLTIRYSNIGLAYAGHEHQEKLLVASNRSCTIVRPVGLTNAKGAESIRISFENHPRPHLTISRRSVARFMVEAINTRSLIGKLPVISKE